MSEERPSRFETSVVLSLAETLGRRRFMGLAVRAAGGLAAAIVGVSRTVQQAAAAPTFNVDGCHLCAAPSNCACNCSWSWAACSPGGQVFSCKECYANGSGCNGGCGGSWRCSVLIAHQLRC
jgi:hypothetical protein